MKTITENENNKNKAVVTTASSDWVIPVRNPTTGEECNIPLANLSSVVAELLPKSTIDEGIDVDEIKRTCFADVTSNSTSGLPINYGAFICLPLGSWYRYIQICFDYTSGRCYYRMYQKSWSNWLLL